jgi:hypothetical protein
MARNRRNGSAAAWLGPLAKVILLCLFFGGSGVGYVWQKKQIHELGQQKGRKEQRLMQLREHNRALRDALAALSSPRALDARVKELNLGLVVPPPEQILRLEEPLPRMARGEREEPWTAGRDRPASKLQARR